MSGFKFSTGVNAINVFLVNRSELEGRLDCAYNFVLRRTDLKTYYPMLPIRSLFKTFSGGTPSKAISNYWNGDIPWASPKDFKTHLLEDTEDHITEDAIKNSATNVAPEGALLMVVRSGVLLHTIPVAITKRAMAFNQDVKAFIAKGEVSTKFLAVYFQINNEKILPLIVKHSTTVQSINTSQLDALKIPNPPINIQKKIIATHEKAELAAKQREKQAQALLDGIDGYLLNELGITLPEQDNSLEKRIFTVPFRNVIGRRLDAPVQRSSFSLLSSKYPMSKLVKEFEFNPSTVITSQFCSFIPMEKISDSEGVVTSSEETLLKAESNGYTRFAENDLLWARITPCMQNGKSAVATNLINGFGYGSTEYFVFRARNGNNIHYLHALLRTRYVREAAMFYFGGATGHQRVSLDFFNDMLIPLPPFERQNEIAAHISNIRAQAKQLQTEATQVLSDAKAQIERMILGDAA